MGNLLPSEGASAIGAEDKEDVLGRVKGLVKHGLVVQLSRPKSTFDRQLDVSLIVGLRGEYRKVSSVLAKREVDS